MPHVLITVSNGVADYCHAGTVRVALVDYDQLDRDDVFPEQIDAVIKEVRALGKNVPWRDNTIRILQGLRRKAVDRLVEGWEGGDELVATDEGG